MNPAQRTDLVRAVHAAPLRIVLAVTGGGVAAIGDLLNVPGASKTVLEVTVPYAEDSLAGLLGAAPDGACTPETAAAMAAACRLRALQLSDGTTPVAGVACTAALVTDRPKRCDHRAHGAVDTGAGADVTDVVLDKGALDRVGEDRVVADVILRALAAAAGVEGFPQGE